MKLIEKVSETLKISKKASKKLIDSKNVFVNGKRTWIASHEVSDTDRIKIIQFEKVNPKILFEDDDLLIIDKPPGWTSTGNGSLESVLAKKTPNLQAVHRLDRDTSGINIFTKNGKSHQMMLEIFKNRSISKTYLALVSGAFPFPQKAVNLPLEGKNALTEFIRLEHNNQASILLAKIETGRTHQIRLHLKSIGFHLIGEKSYFTGDIKKRLFQEVPRQMLHSWKTGFSHPREGDQMDIVSPIPSDMKKLILDLDLHLPD